MFPVLISGKNRRKAMEKRITLLAGYDKNKIIRDYVVYLVQELSKISDVYYFADGKLPRDELDKIRPYVKYAESSLHQGYDFGSWQYLIHFVGWNKLSQYDEMIICNDSVYGPMTELQDIFDYMGLRGYDFWGLTENYTTNYHLDSYFMVFNNNILKNAKFREFWQNITPGFNRKTYETVLTPFLTELGFVGNSYIKNYKKDDMLAYPLHLLEIKNMPFIRVKSLKEPKYYLKETVFNIDGKIHRKTGYKTEMINKHLSAVGDFSGFGVKYYLKNTMDSLKSKFDNFIPRL